MIIPILINDFLTAVHQNELTDIRDLAELCINEIQENLIFIQEEIAKDFRCDKIKSDFLTRYCGDLENFKLFILTNAISLQDVCDILQDELYYIYKNIQLDYVNFYKLDVEFITSKDSCEVCQFLSRHDYDYSYHFSEDSCQSYLKLKPVFTNFVNVLHIVKLYRVPIQFRKTAESFLNYLQLKDIPVVKRNIFYFLNPEEYDLKEDIVYIVKDSKIYLRFRHRTFKEDLLRVILSVKESEESRKLFYDLLKKENTGLCNPFINFLAKQNSFAFLREFYIANLLYPDTLKEISPETYEFLN